MKTYKLIPVIIIALFLSIPLIKGIGKEPFHSEQWKTWTEDEETASLRWDMRKSLQKKHKLKGMTKLEIIELLGEPDRKNSHKNEFTYSLGAARHGIDYGYLEITFDESDIVADFYIWRG